MSKSFDIPPLFAKKVIAKLESLKTEEEKESERLKREKEAKERLVALEAEERKRRDESIDSWLRGFFESELIKKVFKRIDMIEIHAVPSLGHNEFAREIIDINSDGHMFVVLENDLGHSRIPNLVGKYTATIENEVISDEIRDSLYRSIQNGKIWETIQKSLKKSGFFK